MQNHIMMISMSPDSVDKYHINQALQRLNAAERAVAQARAELTHIIQQQQQPVMALPACCSPTAKKSVVD